MNFTENSTAGLTALALVTTKSKILKVLGAASGLMQTVPIGYVRSVALIPQKYVGGERLARNELLSLFGKMKVVPSGWRIARGAAA